MDTESVETAAVVVGFGGGHCDAHQSPPECTAATSRVARAHCLLLCGFVKDIAQDQNTPSGRPVINVSGRHAWWPVFSVHWRPDLAVHRGLPRPTEVTTFWHRVFGDLHYRGPQGIPIALIHGMTGPPHALRAVFPHTVVHLCVLHLVRRSAQYASWAERKALPPMLRAIYRAPSEALAQQALTAFATSPLGQPIRTLLRSGNAIESASPQPARSRRVYTTYASESLHRPIRKIIKTCWQFPNDATASKLFCLALRNVGKKWRANPDKHWRGASPHLNVLFGDRLEDR